MNPYAVIILVALVGEWLLDRVASYLSLRRLGQEPPPEVRAAYDDDTWARTREYVRARTRFAAFPATFDVLLMLAFWWLGGFPWLEEQVSRLELAPVPHGLVYIGALVLARALLHVPFEAWSTFRIEQRFGFNRTSMATFVVDRIKGLVLGILLGGGLLAAVLALLHAFGPEAWLACWGIVAGLTLILQVVAPVWILPLFFRFQPLEDGDLRERLLAYARRVEFPLQDVYMIDGSRRSSKANAFFTGFGQARRVALFDTLVQRHPAEEIEAVLAHEIGHFKRRHIWQGTLLGILHMGALLFLLSLFLESETLHAAFGLDRPAVHTGLVLFGLLYTPIELLLSLATNALARRNEYEADAFAARTLGEGRSLAAALVQLSRDSLANPSPHPLSVWLHASHPPVPARVRALRGLPTG